MNKKEFLSDLSKKINNYSDKKDILNYYDELISDKVENGEIELDVIFNLGDIDVIVKKLTVTENNINLNNEELKSDNKKPIKKVNTYKLLFIILLFPFWGPILITLSAIVLSLFLIVLSLMIVIIILGVGSILVSIYGLTRLSVDGASALLGIGIGLVIFGGIIVLFPIIARGFTSILKLIYVYLIKAFIWLKEAAFYAIN